MVSREEKTLELGCIATARRKLSFILGQYTTVFQAEVFAIKA
jgi:hypothetical protein